LERASFDTLTPVLLRADMEAPIDLVAHISLMVFA
jgi:hypothetical protein